MLYQESETLELKSSFGEWKEIIITLSAFANKSGGTVIVGLDDSGQPTNLNVGKRTLEDFVNKLRNSTDPNLYPSINVKSFALAEIVELHIPSSDFKPVFAFERAYIRVGKSNVKLSANEIRDLVRKYSTADFDKQTVNVKVTNENLNLKLIEQVKARYYNLTNESNTDFLQKNNLTSNGDLTATAYLCFCKSNSLFPNAVVKAARFKGNDMVHFIDMKAFEGNLLDMPDDILSFVKRHINMEVTIEGKAQRTEQWSYSIEALRETIVNAIVHRDYNDSGNIQVRIFDDRLEVWSPGLLPKDIKIDRIPDDNRSIVRNKLLAQVLYKGGMIENWGTGFHKIVSFNRGNGNPNPLFEEKSGAFVITFFKPDLKTRPRTDLKTRPKPDLKTRPKNINDSDFKILIVNTLKHNPFITIPELSKKIGKGITATKGYIAKLKNDGIITRVGAKKGGYWKLNDEQPL